MQPINQDLSQSDSSAVLLAFQRRLNAPDLLPANGLRRNSGEYALISYINNITGLLLSGNLESVSLFISRTAEHLKQVPPSGGAQPYRDLSNRYIRHVASHLATFSKAASSSEIPAEIANAGPQVPP